MNEDEKRLFGEIVNGREELNSRIKQLMTCVLAVFCVMLIISSVTISIVVVSGNVTVRDIESRHSEVIQAIEVENNKTIQELWRYYFETDYLIPDMTQTQDIKIGDD